METKLNEIFKRLCNGTASIDDERFVEAAFRKVTGSPFSGCKCSLPDAIHTILKKLKTMEKCQFKLKHGIALTRFGIPEIYTKDTLTNEAAIAHLEAQPQDAYKFDFIPENYKVEKPTIDADPQEEKPDFNKPIQRRKRKH